MNTLFNLVGTFQHETREKPGAKVRVEYPKVTLRGGIDVIQAGHLTPDALERWADELAVKHSKHTPYERMWMIDWQLVEIHEQEQAA